jgi:hypothetical protein
MKTSEKYVELFKALSKAQMEIVPPKKDSKSTMFGGYEYVSLGEVINQIDGVCRANGLCISQSTDYSYAKDGDPDQGIYTLHTVITHLESGEQLSTVCRLPIEKPGAQGLGSALTYMRRYQLMALFLLAGEDDDGAAATAQAGKGAGSGKSPAKKPPTEPDPTPDEKGMSAKEVAEALNGDIVKHPTKDYVLQLLKDAVGEKALDEVIEDHKEFMKSNAFPADYKRRARGIIRRKREANKK